MNLHLSVEVSTRIRWSLEKDGGKLISIPGDTKKVRKICHYKKDNILNWVSKVIRVSFGFALFRYVIGPEKLFHFFYQSDSRTKTNHDLVARVSPRFRQFDCFYFEFSLALKVFFFLIDRYFGFGYRNS